MQGYARYGAPKREQCYLTRLKLEIDEYDRTGNKEQLINIANYASLEYQYPEHPLSHEDNNIGSVTRHSIKSG